MGDRIKVEGFIEKIFIKKGQSAKGPWKAYSAKLQRPSGEVDPRFYQFGFETPAFKEGDYVAFEADVKDEKTAQFVKGSGSKLKNAPARPAKPASSGGYGNRPPYAGKGGGGGPKEKDSKVFGKIGGYNTEDDVRRMSYSAAADRAVAAVALLLANDALPMSTAKSKSGTAQRYEEITAAIDKLTVEYFFDAASGRKLTSVADAGSTESRVSDLPKEEPGKEPPPDTTDGDEPPPDEDEQVEQSDEDMPDDEERF